MRRSFARSFARGGLALALLVAACHGRDADAPRSTPEVDAGAPAASASASSAASSSATIAASAASSSAPCRKLSDAAERARKAPCTRGSDCMLAPAGCCAPCGMPSKCDLVAMPRSAFEPFRRATCPSPVACPACASAMPPQIVPFCRAGVCEVVDVPTDAITACEQDSDCLVRDWACCTACDASPVYPIAIRRDAMSTYDDQVCSLAGSCPKCKTGIQGYRAKCERATKHCMVE
jgi:hypothetical protein